MERSTKDAWLSGPGDLAEAEVADVPVKGQSVKVRALSGTAANAITNECLIPEAGRAGVTTRFDNVRFDILRFAQGCVEPSFSEEEAVVISAKYGPAFNRVVRKINEISSLDTDAVETAKARFPGLTGLPAGQNGDASAGGGHGPLQPVRAGGAAGDDA